MKRLITAVICIAILVFFLARGDDAPVPDVEDSKRDGPVFIPIPAETPAEAAERARGIYIFQSPSVRATLDLLADRRFTFTSERRGTQQRRTAQGTWSVSGKRLTLAYTHLEGVALEGGARTVINRWTGDQIALRETGTEKIVTLTKRAAIRIR